MPPLPRQRLGVNIDHVATVRNARGTPTPDPLRAADSDAGGAINIGRGIETSVIDIVEALARHSGDGFAPDHAPERPGEVRRSVLDPSRARE